MSRISSLDEGYRSGDLSVYPEAIDTKDTLNEAKNNAETTLKQSLSYTGKNIIVEDVSGFPDAGIIRIINEESGQYELLYYGKKTNFGFTNLIRDFAGSRRNSWVAGSKLSSSVFAEHHNSIKDAILNIQNHLGLKSFPSNDSLNGILKKLEEKYLSPKPVWRTYPKSGAPGLTVRFQNFSGGDAIRFLWDFGDGSTSIEKNPIHTYQNEGIYSVKLNIITSTGAQGIATKSNYITVDENLKTPFFYVAPENSTIPNYSIQTATDLGEPYQIFQFVDQTDGDISQRFWIFDDGNSIAITDPNIHTYEYSYEKPGSYEPSLLIVFSDQQLKRVFLKDTIEVI
jgi:hypothetical protein